jgi:hypothetical protein
LEPVLGPLTEDALEGGLPDEGDDTWPHLTCDRIQTLARAGEVGGAKVA